MLCEPRTPILPQHLFTHSPAKRARNNNVLYTAEDIHTDSVRVQRTHTHAAAGKSDNVKVRRLGQVGINNNTKNRTHCDINNVQGTLLYHFQIKHILCCVY